MALTRLNGRFVSRESPKSGLLIRSLVYISMRSDVHV